MSDICHIVAFDPGQTTGWCVMGVEKDTLNGAKHVNDKMENQLTVFRTGQIQCLGPQSGWDSLSAAMENDGVQLMVDIVNEYSDIAIVFEDFIADFSQLTMARSSLSPVTIMAKFEMGFAVRNESNLGRIFRQNRSPVKTTCTDDRLKTWGLYDRNSGPHARDATRHAWYFLRNCRGNSIKARELRWRAWPHFFNDPIVEDINSAYPEAKKRVSKGRRIESLG
jgi:hypothetical protein